MYEEISGKNDAIRVISEEMEGGSSILYMTKEGGPPILYVKKEGGLPILYMKK